MLNKKTLLNRIRKARWICSDCGGEHGDRIPLRATWHEGKCCICKQRAAVTENRDFGYCSMFIKKLEKELKKEKKAKAKHENLSLLWKKASRAMQDYYRRADLWCIACKGEHEVMHHWVHWGACSSLRFHADNLVPLCNGCHFKFHNGDIETAKNIRDHYEKKYEGYWESFLIKLKNSPTKKRSKKEEIEYLHGIINQYESKNNN